MKIYKVAEMLLTEAIQILTKFLSDPTLKDLSCVYNARMKLLKIPSDFYGAIRGLQVDADKIRMINRDLYDFITNVAFPMDQKTLDRWCKFWDSNK